MRLDLLGVKTWKPRHTSAFRVKWFIPAIFTGKACKMMPYWCACVWPVNTIQTFFYLKNKETRLRLVRNSCEKWRTLEVRDFRSYQRQHYAFRLSLTDMWFAVVAFAFCRTATGQLQGTIYRQFANDRISSTETETNLYCGEIEWWTSRIFQVFYGHIWREILTEISFQSKGTII